MNDNDRQFPNVSGETLKNISHSLEGEGRKNAIGEWLRAIQEENPELYTLLGAMALVMNEASGGEVGGDFLFGAALVYNALRSQFASDSVTIKPPR